MALDHEHAEQHRRARTRARYTHPGDLRGIRCTGRASLLLLRVGGPPGDRTPNPRIKRERVSRSRCAELRKHAQHESLGAHRFHLCYTITRHKTCHVSGGYISAAIRARSTSSRAVTAPGLRRLPRSPRPTRRSGRWWCGTARSGPGGRTGPPGGRRGPARTPVAPPTARSPQPAVHGVWRARRCQTALTLRMRSWSVHSADGQSQQPCGVSDGDGGVVE